MEAEMPKYVIVVEHKVRPDYDRTDRFVDLEFVEVDDKTAVKVKKAFDKKHRLSESESTLYKPV